MDTSRRRELIQQYKERKPRVGVVAVRCAATGEAWVGATRNLDSARNPVWMSLRLGSCRVATLQAAWKAHGEAGLVFETLEELDIEGMTPLGVGDLLKSREKHWMAELSARWLHA